MSNDVCIYKLGAMNEALLVVHHVDKWIKTYRLILWIIGVSINSKLLDLDGDLLFA